MIRHIRITLSFPVLCTYLLTEFIPIYAQKMVVIPNNIAQYGFNEPEKANYETTEIEAMNVIY